MNERFENIKITVNASSPDEALSKAIVKLAEIGIEVTVEGLESIKPEPCKKCVDGWIYSSSPFEREPCDCKAGKDHFNENYNID